MSKYLIYSIILTLLNLVLSNVQGEEISVIVLISMLISMTLIFVIGFRRDINLVGKFLYISIISVVSVVLLLIAFKINEDLFNYYFNILHMKIYYIQ